MRSRNVEFVSRRLKPFTRVYTFFNGIDVNKFTTPKLIEITMSSGTFQVGETVEGNIETSTAPGSANLNIAPVKPDPKITFRVATSNHKYGPFNEPTQIFTANPYNSSQPVPADYSSTSTILNVDTFSLSQQAQGDFFGYIQTGMKLRGQTSGAEAVVSDVRLITDTIGVLIGSFYIPNPNVFGNPRFETGSKLFRITNSSSNSLVDATTTSAEEKFYSEGKINRVQENILSVRTVRTETQTITESKTESLTGPTAVVATTIVGNTLPPYVPPAPPVVPAEPPTQIDYFNEPAPPSYAPVEDTPFGGGFDDGFDGGGEIFTPERVDPEPPDVVSPPATPPPSQTTSTRGGCKPSVEFLPVTSTTFGTTLNPGNSGSRITRPTSNKSTFSVPLQTACGKTWAQIKQKDGKKAANKAFKDAGIKVTKTDRSFTKQQKDIKFKTTKKQKSALPKKNAPGIAGSIRKQLEKDRIVRPQKTRNSNGLLSIVPKSINNSPAGKGKKNNNKKKR